MRSRFDDVIAAAQGGAGWAFTELYEGLARPVAAYVRFRGAADPDDVASETFLQAFRDIGRFDGTEAQFRAWIFTIARRRVLDEARRRGRRPSEVSLDDWSADPVGGDVEEDALATFGDDRVRALVASLSPDQRDVILLRFVADLSLEEVARVTGRRVGAVKALQHRALSALRRRLEQEAVSP